MWRCPAHAPASSTGSSSCRRPITSVDTVRGVGGSQASSAPSHVVGVPLADTVAPPTTSPVAERPSPTSALSATRPHGSTASGLGRPPRRTRLARALGWILLIAVLVGTSAALLARRFFYGNDDLLQFATARVDGLSWRYLSFNLFQHFGPYDRFGHWLVYHFTDLSPVPGLALVLLDQALLLAAALWLMTELRLSAPRRAVALVVITLSAPTTESTVWFDAGMHVLPAIAVTLAICAAHVRGVRTGRWTWHAATVVLFLLGQLVQERPILALPLLVLVDLLLLWRTLPWRTRVNRLWQLRAPLAVLSAAAVAVAAALRVFVVQDSYGSPDWWVTARTMLSALANYLAPSLVNQPLARPAAPLVQLLVVAALIAAGLVLARLGPHNAGPVLFAAAAFGLYYGFLKFSPLLNEQSITATAERLNNAVYVTVPAIIGLAHLRFSRLHVSRPHLPAQRSAGLRRGLQVAGCLAFAGYLLVSDVAYLERNWAATTEARAYLDAVRASAPAWSATGTTLVPLSGNPALATSWSRPLARQELLLPLIRKDFVPAATGGTPLLIDDHGHVRRAALDVLRPAAQVTGGACGARHRFVGKADLAFPVTGGEPLFLRLRYEAAQDADVAVSGGLGRRWTENAGLTTLRAGERTQLIPIDATRVQRVDLQVVTTGAGLCLDGGSIVRALVVDGRRCRAVDVYGRPGAFTRCR